MVVPRTFRFQHEKIEVIDFHVFSAASIIGTAMLCMQSFNSYQEYHKDQQFQNHEFPKRTLLYQNWNLWQCIWQQIYVKLSDSLEEQPIRKFYGWIDISVALDWIRGRGTYKQFLSNRVNKIYVKRILSFSDAFQQIVTLVILVAAVAVKINFIRNDGMDLHGYSVNKIGHQILILNLQ